MVFLPSMRYGSFSVEQIEPTHRLSDALAHDLSSAVADQTVDQEDVLAPNALGLDVDSRMGVSAGMKT